MKVLFFLAHLPKRVIYQHTSIVLAEGLRNLGIEFYGNIDYWQESLGGEYLIKQKTPDFKADIHIYETHYFDAFSLDPKDVLDKSVINVTFDTADGYFTKSKYLDFSKHFTFVLRSHYVSKLGYPDNVYPWVFGISNRIMAIIEETKSQPNEYAIANTYRVGYNSRLLAKRYLMDKLKPDIKRLNFSEDTLAYRKTIDETLQLFWNQTARRHDPNYYKTLNKSSFSLCFGGAIVPYSYLTMSVMNNNTLRRVGRQLITISKTLGVSGVIPSLAYQFDSWRLWESLISNAIPIHLDFENWGFELPVMPKNGVHYIGIEGLNFKKSLAFIHNLSQEGINSISNNGRDWGLENYSPTPTAKRFLELLKRHS